ncbi:MAG: cysteine synthase family protein [Candidatus Hatepunaea meridiana]|nr:cysteine synthase family protein [Candidatus Hatepunaea meridiana]
MLTVADDLTELIGKTPLLRINRLFPESNAKVYAKLELCNPMSIKDRPVLSMIRAAIAEGKIGSETEVVEASSGNTAIAIASLGTMLGFPVRIYMSELCSIEKQKIICAYGAKVIVTPGAEHTKGARERAIAYCRENQDSTFFLNQHSNPNNGRAHETTTGPEIWQQTDGKIDAIVIGLGTSGSFDGLSRFFKSKNQNIHVAAFEPASSPVYSGGVQGKHKIIGIGPGFVTDNFKRSQHNLDELIHVSDEAAYEWVRLIAYKEGLLVGPSSGAAAWASGQLAHREEFADKTIVCIFYDSGERYLSMPDLFRADTIEKGF